MGECEPRNFLQPCLLLLLRERSDHGYDLVNRLRALHAVDGDAGAVYRALRGLEKQGMVRSSWQTSGAGPARRTYQVTPLGVATLDRQADLLEETHRTLHLFRERYRRMGAGIADRTPSGADAAAGNGTSRSGAGDADHAADGGCRHGASGHRGMGERSFGNSTLGNGAPGYGGRGNGAVGNGLRDGGGNGGGRRNGHDGGTAGGAHGDPGGRGIRPPRLPGQRAGQ